MFKIDLRSNSFAFRYGITNYGRPEALGKLNPPILVSFLSHPDKRVLNRVPGLFSYRGGHVICNKNICLSKHTQTLCDTLIRFFFIRRIWIRE